jgi:hypothetical protein
MKNVLARAARQAPIVAVSPRRKTIAALVAGASDLAQMVFFPAFVEGAASPLEVALDATTALVILLIVGFKWRLAFALALELVPGVDLFPTWTAMVLSLPTEAAAPALPREAHTPPSTEALRPRL